MAKILKLKPVDVNYYPNPKYDYVGISSINTQNYLTRSLGHKVGKDERLQLKQMANQKIETGISSRCKKQNHVTCRGFINRGNVFTFGKCICGCHANNQR